MDRNELIIIFSKAPISGLVKTRMFPHLSFDEAAELHSAFLSDMVDLVLGIPYKQLCLAYTPDTSLKVFKKIFSGKVVEFLPQRGEDLGDRMSSAFDCAFMKDVKKAVIIGSDIPTMRAGHITEALDNLDAHDMSICPSADGGYCIIALKMPRPELFDGIRWSTPGVFDATINRAKSLGMKTHVLPALQDVDTFEDLKLLYGTTLPPRTDRVFRKLKSRLRGDGDWLT